MRGANYASKYGITVGIRFQYPQRSALNQIMFFVVTRCFLKPICNAAVIARSYSWVRFSAESTERWHQFLLLYVEFTEIQHHFGSVLCWVRGKMMPLYFCALPSPRSLKCGLCEKLFFPILCNSLRPPEVT